MPQTESSAEQAALGQYPVDRSAPASFIAGEANGKYVRQVVSAGTPLPVYNPIDTGAGFTSGVVNFTPVATATDILALQPTAYGRVGYVNAVVASGTCTGGGATQTLVR